MCDTQKNTKTNNKTGGQLGHECRQTSNSSYACMTATVHRVGYTYVYVYV